MSCLTTRQHVGQVSYLRPLAFLAEQVSVSISLPPVQFEGVGPHQLPVAEVVNLSPLLLSSDTCQELLLGLQTQTAGITLLLQQLHELSRACCGDLTILTYVKSPLSKAILAV